MNLGVNMNRLHWPECKSATRHLLRSQGPQHIRQSTKRESGSNSRQSPQVVEPFPRMYINLDRPRSSREVMACDLHYCLPLYR